MKQEAATLRYVPLPRSLRGRPDGLPYLRQTRYALVDRARGRAFPGPGEASVRSLRVGEFRCGLLVGREHKRGSIAPIFRFRGSYARIPYVTDLVFLYFSCYEIIELEQKYVCSSFDVVEAGSSTINLSMFWFLHYQEAR